MTDDTQTARFVRETDIEADSPTLIEGLPGLGMVASIAVDQITNQLELEFHGSIQSEEFPHVAAFSEGRVRDAVRVYASGDPAVMTLQSDVPIPQRAVRPLSRCVHQELAAEFDKAVFLAGAPADSEAGVGSVVGVATDDRMRSELSDVGIELAEDPGLIGGVTGGLVADCYHDDVPAAVLVVQCDPRLPDPDAAQSVIENAIEPLVEFDIDTTELEKQAQKIQEQKQQVARQLREMQQHQQEETVQSRGMYQ
jgi:uncharacterized protein